MSVPGPTADSGGNYISRRSAFGQPEESEDYDHLYKVGAYEWQFYDRFVRLQAPPKPHPEHACGRQSDPVVRLLTTTALLVRLTYPASSVKRANMLCMDRASIRRTRRGGREGKGCLPVAAEVGSWVGVGPAAGQAALDEMRGAEKPHRMAMQPHEVGEVGDANAIMDVKYAAPPHSVHPANRVLCAQPLVRHWCTFACHAVRRLLTGMKPCRCRLTPPQFSLAQL